MEQYLSKPVVECNSVERVRETILHEIAHAKAGNRAGHGRMWKVMAIAVGAKPETCCGSNVIQPKGRWQAVCGCGLVFNYYRTPSTKSLLCSYCSDCYKKFGRTEQTRLKWRDTRDDNRG